MREPYGGEPPSQAHSETSNEAAGSIKPHLGRLQVLVLEAIKELPRTDEELFERTGLAPNTVRPRRRELQLKGLIRDSERKAVSKSGRRAVIWEAIERG